MLVLFSSVIFKALWFVFFEFLSGFFWLENKSRVRSRGAAASHCQGIRCKIPRAQTPRTSTQTSTSSFSSVLFLVPSTFSLTVRRTILQGARALTDTHPARDGAGISKRQRSRTPGSNKT